MLWDEPSYGCGEPFRDMKWNGTYRENNYSESDMPQFIKTAICYGNFTYISPTIYLAHQAIATTPGTIPTSRQFNREMWYNGGWMRERPQHPDGEVLKPGIIALNSTDVFSWSQKNLDSGLRNAQLVAQGKLRDPRPNRSSQVEGE